MAPTRPLNALLCTTPASPAIGPVPCSGSFITQPPETPHTEAKVTWSKPLRSLTSAPKRPISHVWGLPPSTRALLRTACHCWPVLLPSGSPRRWAIVNPEFRPPFSSSSFSVQGCSGMPRGLLGTQAPWLARPSRVEPSPGTVSGSSQGPWKIRPRLLELSVRIASKRIVCVVRVLRLVYVFAMHVPVPVSTRTPSRLH